MTIHEKQNTKACINFLPRARLTLMTASLFLMFQTAFADINQVMEKQIETVLKNAAAEVNIGLQELKLQLEANSDAAVGYEKRYCKIDSDADCLPSDGSDNDAINDREKNSVVIDFATGGWVVGYSGNLSPESTNLAPASILVENFDLVDNGVNDVFALNLCLEVNFKNTDEVEYALPFYANKTIVFCAITSSEQVLVNINKVDNITSDTDATHKVINEGITGWRCFNPHDGLDNGGQGFGYDEKVAGTVTKIVNTLHPDAQIFSKCLSEATQTLPSA